MNSRIVCIILPLLIFATSFLVYFPSLNNSFVWDDQILIEKSYKKFKNVNFERLFFPPERKAYKQIYYRPAIRSSLIADYSIWKKNSFGYHLTNNLFFSLTAVAFYFLALLIFRRFSKEKNLLFPVTAATLVFTLHPMHVESVSWIVGRTDLICAFFLILALIAHIQSSRNVFLVLAPVFFVLSLMSKEVAVAFPFIAVFYDILAKRFKKRDLLILTIYILILALYIFMRLRSFSNITPIDISSGSGSPSLNADNPGFQLYLESVKILICSLGVYIGKLLAPFSFNAYIPEVSTKTVDLISSIVITAAVAVVFITSLIRRYYILSLSIFITVITLGPSLLISVMSIAATPLAERYLFIPSIGYALFTGYVFFVLSKKIGLRVTYIPLVLLLALYLYFNVDRQTIWKDRLSFWQETSRNSIYAFPHSNYALALEDSGNDEKAFFAYSVALNPEIIDSDHGRAITANNLALLYIKNEQFQEAEATLRRALELSPNFSKTFYNLGLINFIKGEVTGSEKAYETALDYVNKASVTRRKNPKLNLLKAKILIGLGQTDAAMKEIEVAITTGLEGVLLEEANTIKKVYEKSGDDNPRHDTDQ